MINLENDKVITVYSFDQNNAYCGKFQYHWAKGTGLAANSTNIQPPEFSEGFIPILVDGVWETQQDHRGKTVYSITDQSEIKVEYVGEIKDGFTELKPTSIFDTWNGSTWVDNRTAEEVVEYQRSQYPSLTRYQFKRCLLENGYKSSDIESQILRIKDEMTQELTLLGFKEATNFVRTDDSILAMQSVLGLSNEKVDELWEYAMEL